MIYPAIVITGLQMAQMAHSELSPDQYFKKILSSIPDGVKLVPYRSMKSDAYYYICENLPLKEVARLKKAGYLRFIEL